MQWRYTRDADGEYHWAASSHRPICPMSDRRSLSSRLAARPTITIRKASEALVLQALAHSGCHRDPRWAAATTYAPGGITTPAPLMP